MRKQNINTNFWKSLEKTIVFIDSSNIIYSLKDLKWKIDYKKLQLFFRKNTELVNIYFYSAHFDSDEKQKSFFEMLSRKGFIMRTKKVKKIKTKGGIVYKGNLDVELTIDAIDAKEKYNTIILLSGDSDFSPLIDYLRKYNKKIISISSRGHVSKEIIKASDKYLWLENFSEKWKLENNNPKITKPRISGASDEFSKRRISKNANKVKVKKSRIKI